MFRRKHNRRYIVGEFLLNDFRFWNEIQCFKRQAEFIANSGGSGMYSATDEEILHDKARLICDQFLSSQILPKECGFYDLKRPLKVVFRVDNLRMIAISF